MTGWLVDWTIGHAMLFNHVCMYILHIHILVPLTGWPWNKFFRGKIFEIYLYFWCVLCNAFVHCSPPHSPIATVIDNCNHYSLHLIYELCMFMIDERMYERPNEWMNEWTYKWIYESKLCLHFHAGGHLNENLLHASCRFISNNNKQNRQSNKIQL